MFNSFQFNVCWDKTNCTKVHGVTDLCSSQKVYLKITFRSTNTGTTFSMATIVIHSGTFNGIHENIPPPEIALRAKKHSRNVPSRKHLPRNDVRIVVDAKWYCGKYSHYSTIHFSSPLASLILLCFGVGCILWSIYQDRQQQMISILSDFYTVLRIADPNGSLFYQYN